MSKDTLSTDTQELFDYARDLLDDGDLEQALEQARLLLAEDDSNPMFWLLEGQIRLALGETQPAERAFDRACQLAPGLPEPLFHKANYHLVLEEYEEAHRLGEQALEFAEDDEDRFNAYLLLGESQFGFAQMQIMEWIEEMVEIEEDVHDHSHDHNHDHNHDHLLDLPPLPKELEELLHEGLATTQKALKISGELPEAWDLQARYQIALGMDEQALESWKEASLLDPEEPLYLHHIATTYLDQEQFEEAYEAFHQLFELERNNDEGMEFSRQEFREIAEEVCQEIEVEVHDYLETPVIFRVEVEDFPTEDYLDSAPAQYPFDPWIPCVLKPGPPSDTHESVTFILFQRNVERELESDDPHALYHYLSELMREFLMQASEAITDEPIEA